VNQADQSDPTKTFVMRYTLPLAVVAIVAVLLFYRWMLKSVVRFFVLLSMRGGLSKKVETDLAKRKCA
jgi:hypothetical protein